MAPRTAATTHRQLMTPCPQCSTDLIAPDWSEHHSERSVRHSWSCEPCGYQFETLVVFPAAAV